MLSGVNAALSVIILFVGWKVAFVDACSRILYKSDYGYIAGRSMDWFEPTSTDIWAFPAGMVRDGGVGEGSLKWVSKYGSVVASMYDVATADGGNTAGLAANVLYLAEADYGELNSRPNGTTKLLSVGAWGQYVLDMFATVKEAVDELEKDDIQIVGPELPNGSPATGHLSLSDPSGDSAVFEYIDGKLIIHHGPEYNVMTNSPPFDEQLAIAKYFDAIGGLKFMPGTHTAADRFVRLTYNLGAVMKVEPPLKTEEDSLATALSVMRHISVPYGVSDPDKPNIATTFWRTLYDHKATTFYYEPVVSHMSFWVHLPNLNLAEGDPIMKLELDDREDDYYLGGEVSKLFEEVDKPFAWLAPEEGDGKNCLYKDMKIEGKLKLVEHPTMVMVRMSKKDDAEGCNEACKSNEDAEVFTFNSKNKQCTCYMKMQEDAKLTFVSKRFRTSAYVMEDFKNETCSIYEPKTE